MNDFEYSPALGVIFYTTDYAVKSCNLDGSNELTLFNSTVTKFERIALDLPAQRLFYTTTGMPETVKRIMSSKFDGSDKFRHYTIPIKNQQSPAIQIFENGIIITDSSKNSPIYHSKKVLFDFLLKKFLYKKLISYIQFNTDNALFNELFYDKNAINLVIMNKALNSVDFLKVNPKFKPYKNGIMRITRNPATTAADLISSLDNSDFTVDEYFGCADNHRNFHNFDNIKPCSGECPQFQLGGAGYNSTSTSGNVLSRSGNSPKLIYKLGYEHLNRQNTDSRM